MTGELDQAVRAEIAEALANDVADRPQRCGHSSSPMCCPLENFPVLAAWFESVLDDRQVDTATNLLIDWPGPIAEPRLPDPGRGIES